MNEVKGEIPSITNLATTAALTAMENKIPDVSDLVKKKQDYYTKISEMRKKSILLLLIIESSQKIYLIQRQKKNSS